MSRTRTITLTLGSLAVGAVLATGATGLAMADDAGTSTGTSAGASATAPSADGHGLRDGRGHGGPGMLGAIRDAVGEPVHGETVVKKDDGSFATIRHLHGTVTAVSAGSITVKAEDGYSATFAVNSDTTVRTGLPERGSDASTSSSTIADVKVGDVAHVSGVVEGSTATADRVLAMTAEQAAQLDALRAEREQAHADRTGDASTGGRETPSATSSSIAS